MKKIYIVTFLLTLSYYSVFADFTFNGPTTVCPNELAKYDISAACYACIKPTTITVEGGVIVAWQCWGAATCSSGCGGAYTPIATPVTSITIGDINSAYYTADRFWVRWNNDSAPGKITGVGNIALSCCASSSSITCPTNTVVYNVTVKGPVVGNVPASICLNETKTFSILEDCGSTFDWLAPPGWSIQGGGNTLSATSLKLVSIKAPATGSGFFQIKVKRSQATNYTITINVWLGVPVGYTGSISGPTVVGKNCIVSYSIPPMPGATSYTWRFPAPLKCLNGSTDCWRLYNGTGTGPTIYVVAGLNSGQIEVTATGCGFTTPSTYLYVSTTGQACSGPLPPRLAAKEPLEENINPILNVFPNPSNGEFDLQADLLEEKQQVQIVLYNSLGQVVKNSVLANKQTISESFNLNQYPKGMYHIRLIADKIVLNKKIAVE